MSTKPAHQGYDHATSGAVGQRIAELAELVAAGCKTPVESQYVREEFEALVDEIRAAAEEGAPRSARRSGVRLKEMPGAGGAAEFEFRNDPEPEHRDADAGGWSRVVSLEDARRVLEAIRNEETSGGGPREDLQRAIA